MLRLSADNVLFTRLGFDKRYLLNQPVFTADLCKIYVRALVKRSFKHEPELTEDMRYFLAVTKMANEVADVMLLGCRIDSLGYLDAIARYEEFGSKLFSKKLTPKGKPSVAAPAVAEEPAPKAKAKRVRKAKVLQPELISL